MKWRSTQPVERTETASSAVPLAHRHSVMREAASPVTGQGQAPAEVKLTFRSSPQSLFDSSSPGDDVEEYLTAQLPAGDYMVSTLVFEPTQDISLLLHWVRSSRGW